MAYEPKPGQGSMFKNEKKESDNHPDYKGDIMLPDGTMAWLDAWVKKPEGKKPFMSVSLKVKQPRNDEQQKPAARQQQKPVDDFEDSIPF
jgi:hypothetical protein